MEVVSDTVVLTCRNRKCKSQSKSEEVISSWVSCHKYEKDCQECLEEEEDNLVRLRQEHEMDVLIGGASSVLSPVDEVSCSAAWRHWGNGPDHNNNSKKGRTSRRARWSLRDILIITATLLVIILSSSEVAAKSDMMPEDDFDSSNKKVKFEDFDTNVTPMQASGGGLGSGGTNDPKGHPGDKETRAAGSSLGFIHAFIASFSVIVVSELGDKTFFIAAIMAMRHSRITVFAGAISALSLMTILSALFGYATTIIPKAITYYISTALFAIFGLKMLYDGFRMSPDEGAEELEEVQATLRRRDDDNNDIESQKPNEVAEANQGYRLPSPIRRILFTLFSRVFLQALTMTFLAEWGDRSQIATIILAAREDVPGVCIGGILGHSCCTGLAVLGGRMIAQKISVRTVTIIGGIVFIVFAITSLFFNPDNM